MQSFKFDQSIRYKLHLMGQNLQQNFAAAYTSVAQTAEGRSQEFQLAYPSEQSLQ